MNWNELNEAIRAMPALHRAQEVRFVEPYDKQRAGYYVEIVFAEEDITIEGGDQPWDEPEQVFVLEGEPFLR